MPRRLTILFTLVLTLIVQSSGFYALTGVSDIASAEAWLAHLDETQDSWSMASAQFQTNVISTQWEQMVQAMRTYLGTVKVRTYQRTERTTTLPGLPHNTYTVVTFHTSFTQQPSITETVVLISETDGILRVLDYNLL